MAAPVLTEEPAAKVEQVVEQAEKVADEKKEVEQVVDEKKEVEATPAAATTPEVVAPVAEAKPVDDVEDRRWLRETN